MVKTFPEFITHIRDNFSNPKALNYRDQNGWHAISTEEFLQQIENLALCLVSLGLKKGDRVGIHSVPSPFWTIVDIAIMSVGGVSVPIFPNISEDNYVYEITQSELKIIFIDGPDLWEVYRRHRFLFKHAIAMGEHPAEADVISYNQALQMGKNLGAKQPHLLEEIGRSIRPNDLGAIIYTSGTTGKPKGVELTHWNMMCTEDFNMFNFNTEKDRYLSILPLAHVLGHCTNLWAVTWGISVYYTNDYKNLSAVCKEIQPTITVVVPRLLEKIFIKINEQIEHSNFFKRNLGLWAIRLARSEDSLYKRIMHPIADFLVYSKFRNALGGKLRAVLTGGAPLNPHLQYFFNDVGVAIYEGWGLTEACPVCVNLPGKNKIGKVGTPIKGEIAISPEGEILVKGPLVMNGYHKNPEATSIVIDKDGWLHTGDKGTIDSDGYLTIIGRLKELYKTSTGEYVAPVPIEQALTRNPLIEMAMVVAEGRKFTSCLLFPNFETLRSLKTQRKMSHLSDEEFLNGPYVRKEMEKMLNEINSHLNHWEQVHEYRFILTPLTTESGELTPSMKIKRDIVSKKYCRVINSMYNEEVA